MYISWGLTVAVVGLSCFLVLRVRKLGMLVLMLQTGQRVHSQQDPLIWQSEEFPTLPDVSETGDACDPYVLNYALLALMAFSFILALGIVLTKCARCSNSRFTEPHTSLSLMLTNGSRCISVPLIKLPHCIREYEIRKGKVRQLKLKWGLCPTIAIEWLVRPQVVAVQGCKTLEVKSEYRVTWIQYYMVSQIQKEPYEVSPVVTHAGVAQCQNLLLDDLGERGSVHNVSEGVLDTEPSATSKSIPLYPIDAITALKHTSN